MKAELRKDGTIVLTPENVAEHVLMLDMDESMVLVPIWEDEDDEGGMLVLHRQDRDNWAMAENQRLEEEGAE